jgi:SanA protein
MRVVTTGQMRVEEQVAAPQTDRRLPRRPRRWIGIGLLLGLLLLGASPWMWRSWVEARYAGQTYAVEPAVTAIPAALGPEPQVAVVFGARVYRSGRLSPMLQDRVDTAIDLYHTGVVDTLIMSGGQVGEEYDEPAAMIAYAQDRGVPAAALQPDYGGQRTYDSCYRAAHIFQLERAVLVTQAFHLPRALLLCDQLGMEVVGVVADRRTYGPASLGWSEARETPALVGALLDLIRRTPPPILGEPIPLGERNRPNAS